MSRSRTVGQSEFAVRLFLVWVAVLTSASVLGWTFTRVFGEPVARGGVVLPRAFICSTVLLLVGSWLLQHALHQVRLERQRPFRRSLLAALATGTLFIALQSYGLWYLLHAAHPTTDTQTGAHGFVFVFALLHALHFTVAMMFLVYVTLQSQRDRYDHEYYWGVTVCTGFWHVLGLAWLAILLVFFFAVRQTL